MQGLPLVEFSGSIKYLMLFALAKYYCSLSYWDRASRRTIKKMQLQKFKELFEFACRYSRFYRTYYGDHGVLDLNIKSYDDIQRIPVIKKSVLKECAMQDLITCGMDHRIQIHSTSGSTGAPFKVAFNKVEDYTAHVRVVKILLENGYLPFKKIMLISRYEAGHQFEVEADFKKLGILKKRFGLFNFSIVSIFDPIEMIITKLETVKPFVVWSTPSVMEVVALELKKKNRKLNVPLVLFMSETLSPLFLQLCKERIGSRFIDLYGCMESPSMAYGVDQTEYKRVFCNTTLIEAANKRVINGKNISDVVITNLINHTMPIIRYDLGDFMQVLPDEDFPIRNIGPICGRIDDIIRFGDSYTLTHHQTYQLFNDFYECEQYKFIQKTTGEIVLQLKINNAGDRELVRKKALQRWNSKYPHYPLQIEYVNCFPVNPENGKLKVIEKQRRPN
jgi:phenylacetate-CoA ligase